jgi:predicted Rossmann fold flavoprotein
MLDLVVIGAGAAGLLAATHAAERGLQTLLVEKNRKPGVKILMSGGTRCNLTQNTDKRGIMNAFGAGGKFLNSALAALGPKELVALVEAEGVATKIEETGKIFPASDRALDVLNALLARFERSGATMSLEEPLVDVEKTEAGFTLTTNSRTIETVRLLITTGGQSYPGSGTTGDGYRWAAKFGHTILPPRPALVPITVEAAWVRELSGVTIPDMRLRVVELPGEGSAKQRVLTERRSSLLFTHFGLSGPAAMDVSRELSGGGDLSRLRLECDFLCDTSEMMLDEQLRSASQQSGRKQVLGVVAEVLPRRLVEALFAQAEIPAERTCAELAKAERQRLVQVIKRTQLKPSGTLGFKKAEVTAGGVSLAEIDSRTMQSKLVPGLYFAGEVLDLDGWIGGYNFQAAFATGWLAAERMG